MEEIGWVVYLVRCQDNTLYCGVTNNLTKRLTQHNQGIGAKYTRGRRPVILVKFWKVETKSQALKLELKIKKMSKNQKINYQITNID